MPTNFHVDELVFGDVQEVDGAFVTVLARSLRLDYQGIEHGVELGAFVLIRAPESDLIATVSSIRLNEAKDENKAPFERKTVRCTLVGYLRSGTTFERGIERYPTIDSKAFLLTENALTSMFQRTAGSIAIGERCQRGGGQEYALVDRLFGRHTAVLGTSGSGKSWTVASLIQAAMTSLEHTRIVFLDLHDEYRSAFPRAFERIQRKVHHVSSSALRLPYWILNFDELAELFLSHEHAAPNQSALLRHLIRELRASEGGRAETPIDRITVDTPSYFDFDALISRLEELNGKIPGVKPNTQKAGDWTDKLGNLILRLQARASDPRYRFLFPDDSRKIDFSVILEELFGITLDSQLTVIDLSGLPSDVLSVIVGVFSRISFEYKYWDRDPGNLPLTLVLEEAHNYLPRIADQRHRICLERVERVAKEGRKYGLGMMIVSQRPSELNETVLSQCANFVVLRLTNPNDQAYVRKLLPDFLAVAVDMLPYLRNGEAVIAGEAVELPTRVRVQRPDPVPRSEDIGYFDGWATGIPAGYRVADAVARWRKRER